MTELYLLIVRVSVEKCQKAAWEIVLRFQPYIKRACYDHEKRFLDEDMMSDIKIRLYKRILGFEVRDPFQEGLQKE